MTDPQHECLHPDVIAGWCSLTSWAKVIIPTCVVVIIALASSAIMVRVDMADLRANQAAAAERRADHRDEILRLRTDLLRLERENALRHTDTKQALRGLETKLDYFSSAMDDRRHR